MDVMSNNTATPRQIDLLIIGGGAAGYFAAANASPPHNGSVLILEASSRPLGKVKVSGGGRCNVTHALFDPAEFVKRYPRGADELRGAFSRFQAKDTVRWFEERGVKLKKEDDGRMFPTTDSSSTIINCLEQATAKAGAEIVLGCKASTLDYIPGAFPFRINAIVHGEPRAYAARKLLLATGSASKGHEFAAAMGHRIEPCVPSLFTFEIDDPLLQDLPGVSANADLLLEIGKEKFRESGPILITHWGLSGPAIIRLSAWAARPLAAAAYNATLYVNWLGSENQQRVSDQLREEKERSLRRTLHKHPLFALPKRLWSKLLERSSIGEEMIWSEVSKRTIDSLAANLVRYPLAVSGKGIFKEEFVTCGGVSRREIDFRTMESKKTPGLYFAGEIIDIDGITGGFNFQSAWTTGWIAAQAASA